MHHAFGHGHEPGDDKQLLAEAVGLRIQADCVQQEIQPFITGELRPGFLEFLDVDAAVLEGREVSQHQRCDPGFPNLRSVVGELRDAPHSTHEAWILVD